MSQKSLLEPDIYNPDFIKGISLFSGLAEEQKADLLKGGQVYFFQRRRILFRQGDAIGNIYIVCSGIVQLHRTTPDGREITLDLLIAGDMTCAKEIFELSDMHTVDATAVSHTIVTGFPRTWLLESAQKNSVFALNLLSAISRRARMIEIEAEHQATMSAAQLAACFLMHLCAHHGFNPRGFDLPISKSLIASRLGMELETLSRTLPLLRKYGITVKGKHVTLHDFPGIDEHVCGHCSVREVCHARRSLWQERETARSSKTEFSLV